MRIVNSQEVSAEDLQYVKELVAQIGDVGLPLDSITFWTINDGLIGTSLRYKEHHDLRPMAQVREFFFDGDTILECLDRIHLYELVDWNYGRYVTLMWSKAGWLELSGVFDHSYMRRYDRTRIAIERNLVKKEHRRGNILSDHTARNGGVPGAEGVLAAEPGQQDHGSGAGS